MSCSSRSRAHTSKKVEPRTSRPALGCEIRRGIPDATSERNSHIIVVRREPIGERRMPELNPLDPKFQADPYPTYAALRDEAPVYKAGEFGFYAITRYDDVTHVLKDPHLFSSS